MVPVFGVHIGNTNLCLAIYKQDDSKEFVEVVANDAGERVMPAMVTILETENIIGTTCKSLIISKCNRTVINNKAMLDRRVIVTEDRAKEAKVLEKDGEFVYEIPFDEGVEYKTPVEISRVVFQSLHNVAKSCVPGNDEISCVLMVPHTFSELARFKVQTAAEEAGWNVLQIINENAAVVLAYNILNTKTPPDNSILVYRLGGTSCDASLIQSVKGMLSVLDSEHSEDIGGRKITSNVAEYLAAEFYRKFKMDPKESQRSWKKLTQAAENCLHVLSNIETANCFVESLCDGVDFNQSISRARLDSILSPLFSKMLDPLRRLLERNNVIPDFVLLCGGPLKIPRVKRCVSDLFKDPTKIAPLPNGINYDELLACGAAWQAGYIVKYKLTNSSLSDKTDIPVLVHPLSVTVQGGQCEELFIEADPLPTSRSITINSPNDKIKLMFTQSVNDKRHSQGEIDLECDEDPTYLDLEIGCDGELKVRKSGKVGDEFGFQVVRMFSLVEEDMPN